MQTHRQTQNIHKKHILTTFLNSNRNKSKQFTQKKTNWRTLLCECTSWQYQELCEITWMERDNPRPCCKE